MTREETAKIMMILKSIYPNAYKDMSNDGFRNGVEAWSIMLKDYTYEQISDGVYAYSLSDKKGFPPSPGQIIDALNTTKHSDDASDMEYVNKILNAARDGTYHANERFDELPPICQQAIGSPDYLRELAMAEVMNPDVQQSNILRQIREARDKQRMRDIIPDSIRARIQGRDSLQGIESDGERIGISEDGRTDGRKEG